MQNEQMEENKMGVMPVNRLLLTMSVPIMISMLVQALYNVVDSIFVAQLSEDALNAVSLAFPMQNLMISVATGTGVGISALLSKSLGEHDTERVQRAARNGVFLALVSFIVFAIIGVFFSRTFFQLQTDIPAIVDGGTQYLLICTLLSFGLFGQICFERLLQSTGKTFYTMITQGLGAILNIIFDPLFIFGIGPFPKMGVAGAASATVLGQIVAFIVSIFINHAKNPEIQLSFKGFRPHGATIARIYAVGVPSIIMASISSVMTFGMNKILISFTSTATAVFGVYFKLQSFVFMPVFGLNNGMVPIIAYNFGARKPDRMKKTFNLAVAYATLIMVLGFAVMQLAPNLMLSFFNASDKMLEIGVPALRINQHQLPAGWCERHLFVLLPGVGPWHAQPVDFGRPSAVRIAAGRLCPQPHRWSCDCLVGLPGRRSGCPDFVRRIPALCTPQGDSSLGRSRSESITLQKFR